MHGVQSLNSLDKKVLKKVYKKYEKVFPVSNTAQKNIVNYFPFLKSKSEVIYSIIDSKELLKNL